MNAYESPVHELSYAVLLVSKQYSLRYGRMTIAVWELLLTAVSPRTVPSSLQRTVPGTVFPTHYSSPSNPPRCLEKTHARRVSPSFIFTGPLPISELARERGTDVKDSYVPSLPHTINSRSHQTNTPVPNLPFPIHGTSSGPRRERVLFISILLATLSPRPSLP